MKPRTHTCAATGCQHEIASHLLMCVDHWRMVPVDLRRPVLATNRERIRLRTVASVLAYREAVANAVAALAAKQTRKMNERAAVEGDLFPEPSPNKHEQLLKEEYGNNTTPGRQPA